MDILGDALVVSPLIRSADLNLQISRTPPSLFGLDDGTSSAAFANGWPTAAELSVARHTRLFATYNLTGSPLSRSWAAQLPDPGPSLRSAAATASSHHGHHKVRSFFYLFGHQPEHMANGNGMMGSSNYGNAMGGSGTAGAAGGGGGVQSPSSSSSFGQPVTDRLASAHGDELPFLFGAPLAQFVQPEAHSFGYFGANFSRAEVGLSEAVITYFTNFAKFG